MKRSSVSHPITGKRWSVWKPNARTGFAIRRCIWSMDAGSRATPTIAKTAKTMFLNFAQINQLRSLVYHISMEWITTIYHFFLTMEPGYTCPTNRLSIPPVYPIHLSQGGCPHMSRIRDYLARRCERPVRVRLFIHGGSGTGALSKSLYPGE